MNHEDRDRDVQDFIDYLNGLRPQEAKEAVEAFYAHVPDAVVVQLQRELRLQGGESRIVAAVKALRRQAVDPSRSQQTRDDTAWLLHELGYDDDSLKAEDPSEDADDDTD